MRKPYLIISLSFLLILILVGLAFVYIDLTGHKSFYYDITRSGVPYGVAVVDRFLTESKVVYKGREVTPFSVGYPSFSSGLYLDRATKTPSKYIREEFGVKGQRTIVSLIQKGEVTDYLFLENPRFIKLENFSTGEKTMVYSPQDLMLVTSLMERYSYWKKGTQYFEVMVLVPPPYPPLRDKVSVRYFGEDYVPVMDRKVEAEIYVISSKALSETKIVVSRHNHRILSMECPEVGVRFDLSSVKEGPAKLSAFSLRNLPFVRTISLDMLGDEDNVGAGYPGLLKEMSVEKVSVPDKVDAKEIFFESGNTILSGELWMPEGDGLFPSVLLVPGEGVRKMGGKLFTDYMGSFLARSGYMVMSFDSPGQGKSQGSFYGMDDSIKARNVLSALKFLKDSKKASGGTIVVLASGTSDNSVLEAASKEEGRVACVLISPTSGALAEKKGQPVLETEIKSVPGISDPGAFDLGFLLKASQETAKHSQAVAESTGDTSYFIGIRLPLKGYRDYLARRPYRMMVSLENPLLVILSRDEPYFNRRTVDALRLAVTSKGDESDVLVLDKLGSCGGTVELVDGKWQFKPKKELFSAVKNWIDKVQVEGKVEEVLVAES